MASESLYNVRVAHYKHKEHGWWLLLGRGGMANHFPNCELLFYICIPRALLQRFCEFLQRYFFPLKIEIFEPPDGRIHIPWSILTSACSLGFQNTIKHAPILFRYQKYVESSFELNFATYASCADEKSMSEKLSNFQDFIPGFADISIYLFDPVTGWQPVFIGRTVNVRSLPLFRDKWR